MLYKSVVKDRYCCQQFFLQLTREGLKLSVADPEDQEQDGKEHDDNCLLSCYYTTIKYCIKLDSWQSQIKALPFIWLLSHFVYPSAKECYPPCRWVLHLYGGSIWIYKSGWKIRKQYKKVKKAMLILTIELILEKRRNL